MMTIWILFIEEDWQFKVIDIEDQEYFIVQIQLNRYKLVILYWLFTKKIYYLQQNFNKRGQKFRRKPVFSEAFQCDKKFIKVAALVSFMSEEKNKGNPGWILFTSLLWDS